MLSAAVYVRLSDQMITQDTLDFFATPTMAAVSSAAAGVPHFTRAFLVEANVGTNSMAVYVPEGMSADLLSDLKSNNRLALVVVDVTTFKSRQYKGLVTATAAASAAENKRVQTELQKTIPVMAGFFGPGAGDGWSRYNIVPAMRLTFEIQDIFNQTPGPGTGARIN